MSSRPDSFWTQGDGDFHIKEENHDLIHMKQFDYHPYQPFREEEDSLRDIYDGIESFNLNAPIIGRNEESCSLHVSLFEDE